MSYETRCFKIRLQPGSIEKVRTWAKTINERKDEALATLRNELVILEIVFLDQTAEGDFLIYRKFKVFFSGLANDITFC